MQPRNFAAGSAPLPRDEMDDDDGLLEQDPLGVTSFLIGGNSAQITAPDQLRRPYSAWNERRPRLEQEKSDAGTAAASNNSYHTVEHSFVPSLEQPSISGLTGRVLPLCRFHLVGNCRYGDYCRFPHGDVCPHCQQPILHPDMPDQRQLHLAECERSLAEVEVPEIPYSADSHGQAPAGRIEEGSELRCGICLESVPKTGHQYGLLLNCDHVYCLPCIRNWRRRAEREANTVEAARSCPLCRNHSHYVIPSWIFPTDVHQKESITEGYRYLQFDE